MPERYILLLLKLKWGRSVSAITDSSNKSNTGNASRFILCWEFLCRRCFEELCPRDSPSSLCRWFVMRMERWLTFFFFILFFWSWRFVKCSLLLWHPEASSEFDKHLQWVAAGDAIFHYKVYQCAAECKLGQFVCSSWLPALLAQRKTGRAVLPQLHGGATIVEAQRRDWICHECSPKYILTTQLHSTHLLRPEPGPSCE